MSLKKNKLDLLFKVRFQNPVPPPPFPPKLINIPTNPSRYAGPDFTASLASETPLPMVVDADLGMPLDLSHYECLWEDGADDAQINPDPEMLPPVDPRDAFMLADVPLPTTNGNYSATSTPTPQVSWLRKTEYISSSVNRTPSFTPHESRRTTAAEDTPIADVSREAQIRDIENLFKAAGDDFDLSTIRHPTKPGVTALESYEILPDTDIWANAYDLFRFSERPGDRAADIPDPRVECGVLRPMEADGDHFLAYFLPREDEGAENFIEKRRNGENVEESIFSFIRDYETVKIEQEVPSEFLLVLDDGVKAEDGSSRRDKGAYYKNIERKITLKKRRAAQGDTYSDKWDAINLSLAPFTSEELEEREEALAEVADPMYMFARADADADADGEVDDTHDVNVNSQQQDSKEGIVDAVVDVTGIGVGGHE